ncbi:MAG: leucyl aminopeptidase [Alphaproteobacteria bacterium]
MNINFGKRAIPADGALLVFAVDKNELLQTTKELDEASKGQITRAMKASRFTGAAGDLLEILAPAGLKNSRLLVAGLGVPAEITPLSTEKAAAGAVKRLLKSGETQLTAIIDPMEKSPVKAEAMAAHFALGVGLEAYEFTAYRTKEKPADKASLKKVAVLCDQPAAAKKLHSALAPVAEGVALARNLVMEPPNVLSPPEFAKRCKALEALGVTVEILGEKEMGKLGMGALLGVGQGSDKESQLAVMTWMGAAKTKKPIAFVGKGVTFDTGGISLKPPAGMEDMKGDMGGAAAVVGAMHALAARKAKANAVGVIGLVENMPGGNAQRPGDIVKSMSGQTIEVNNTDAEGRLVLADALWYTQERFNPQVVIDLATLTGAILIALGHEHAGLFSNNDKLAEQLTSAGKAEGEPVWRLPMGDAYDKLLKSKFADMKNSMGREGGSITAAQFLKRFVKDVPWAHIDIAGMAYLGETKPTAPAWASGFGVRLLNRLVADYFEG